MSDQLTEIQVSLARVEEGVGHLIKAGETTVKRLDAHAKDIKSLNLSRSRAKGFGGAFTAMVSAVAGFFLWFEA